MSGTPGPWLASDMSTEGGYDCMTAGITIGPVLLDGREYGQKPCHELTLAQHDAMLADARKIAALHELIEALSACAWFIENVSEDMPERTAQFFSVRAKWRDALQKVTP